MIGLTIGIKGAGEMASGVAHCLYRANFHRLFMLEAAAPMAVRRRVSFCSAIEEQEVTVEGVTAVKAEAISDVEAAWRKKQIPVIVDPDWRMIARINPQVVVDAILAKKNLGTKIDAAPLVIGLGPGFLAGQDVHVLVETQRGHDLGRLIFSGSAAKDTGVPGNIGGYTVERVLRIPAAGEFIARRKIGDLIQKGEIVGEVAGEPVYARIGGVIRGLIRSGIKIDAGIKLGDIDPRGEQAYCYTISEKARSIGGSVLIAVLMRFNVPSSGGTWRNE